ncbi:MAG: phosphomannomutase/phosphoglucomutase [Pseudomonadota bacterium]
MRRKTKKNQPKKQQANKKAQGQNLLMAFVPWLGVIVLGSSTLLFWIYQEVLVAPAEQRSTFSEKSLLSSYASSTQAQLNAIATQAELLAKLPEVTDLLRNYNEDKAMQLETALSESLNLKHGVRVLLPNVNSVDASSNPPISNVILDLIRTSVQNKQVSPEIIKKTDGQRYLAIVQPVFLHRKHIGNLLLGLDIGEIRDEFSEKFSVKGYLELVQEFGRRKEVLVSVGDKALKTGSPLGKQALAKTNWHIVYWPSNEEILDFTEGQGQFISLSIILILINALAILAGYFLLYRRLNADAAKLTQMLIEVIGRRFEVPQNTFTLSLFNDIASPLSRASKELRVSSQTNSQAMRSKKSRESQAHSQNRKAAVENHAQANQNENVIATAGNTSSEAQSQPMTQDVQSPDLDQALEFTVSHASSIDPTIFRAYDIRGVVGESLTEEVVEEIGKAIGSEAFDKGEQTVIVARDGRLSGPSLIEALKTGLKSSGRDVIDLGVVPTPLLYFATNKLESKTGVMLTGSHNPPNYNGLKIVMAGDAMAGDEIKKLYQRIDSGDLMSGSGSERTKDIVQDYLEEVTGDIALAQPLRVAVDCGNGVAGMIAPKLLEALGCDVIPLYCDVDGNFPNHHPDPSKPENLQDLIKAVNEEKADIGVAFDGDGDRLGVVTSEGEIIYPDRQLMLFAIDVLSRNPGADIIFDVKCTRNLPQVISGHGGRPLMWKTGHSFMKAKMKETGALLGGECSGHIFFKERWYGFDDALYSCARLLEVLGNDFRSSSQVFESLPDAVATPEINVAISDTEKFAFIDKVIADADFGDAEINTIDGLRVDFGDGWGLIRASNTTPNLVIRFEADSQIALEKIQADFSKKLKVINPNLSLPF